MNAARAKLGGLLDTVSKHTKPAVSAAEKEITQRYSRLMKDNQQYVVKDQAEAGKLIKQWWFTKLARWGNPGTRRSGRHGCHPTGARQPQPQCHARRRMLLVACLNKSRKSVAHWQNRWTGCATHI